MLPMLGDTIAAIATAPGAAGLAVVRVSGPEAIGIADRLLRRSPSLAEAPSHTLHHGWAWADGDGPVAAIGKVDGTSSESRLDEVVAGIFRAPRSYTGEDVVEISCHGGRVSAERILDAMIAAGARLAGPGEFTMRAFLNGRLDLAQAEAVADLIHAETGAAHALALSQLAGGLSRRLDDLAERVADARAEVEARVDFAEDVGGIEVPEHVRARIAEVAAALDELLAGAAYARAVREGVRLPIVGKPNVGKSSIFNLLVGEPRAIVTAHPGTTRDRVSEPVEIGGVRVTLSDTAGLRPAADEVERLGIAHAREVLDTSPAALWVVDGSAPLDADDLSIASTLDRKRVAVVLNKRDLGARVTARDLVGLLDRSERHCVVETAVPPRHGVSELRGAIAELIDAPAAAGLAGGATVALSNPRHADALRRARAALERAAGAADEAAPGEIVALELGEAHAAIGEVTGRQIGEDLLERIFSRFCIGK